MIAERQPDRLAASAPAPAPTPTPAIGLPSKAWFERLAALMKAQRALHEKLGYLDGTVRCTVLDGRRDGSPWSIQLHFEEFEVVSVLEVLGNQDPPQRPDFTMEASFETWRGMIDSIAEGNGRPALQQTLNDLNMRSDQLRIHAEDSLQRQLFFRCNQSLQAFVNASASFRTIFARGD